ncbi:MAG: hypothetical protein AAF226_18805, partial [Verrucomicrobiota bacterium]
MLITETEVKENNRDKKLIAVISAVAVQVAIAVVLLLVTVIPAIRDEPEIVADIVTQESASNQMERQTVLKQVRSSAASAASPLTNMVRAQTTAQIVAPQTTSTSTGPVGLGVGDLGKGFGTSPTAMGTGAAFFGSRANGRRFLFILDHSSSMKPEQLALRNKELNKALQTLPEGVQYQVILFAGAAMFAEPKWKH